MRRSNFVSCPARILKSGLGVYDSLNKCEVKQNAFANMREKNKNKAKKKRGTERRKGKIWERERKGI